MAKRTYVDGFVIVIKKSKLSVYKKMAELGRKLWMEHGALDYYECVGDDLNVKWGLPFKKLSKAKSGDAVVFSFITFKSKAHRNLVNKKVMGDPRMNCDADQIPFDMKRFSYGGFKVLLADKRS